MHRSLDEKAKLMKRVAYLSSSSSTGAGDEVIEDQNGENTIVFITGQRLLHLFSKTT